MKKKIHVVGLSIKLSGLLMLVLGLSTGCKKDVKPKALKEFNQVNLVASSDAYNAAHVETTMINAWGLAFNATGIAWVNTEDGHTSFVLDKEGARLRAPVDIPSPTDTIGGTPTGIIANGSGDFVLNNNQPARFVFVGSDGVLSGWNPAAGNRAIRIKDNSATSGYTGLTLAVNGGNNMLYAANFKAGKIDVWDKTFTKVDMTFTDPNIPAGYSPFNIQAAGDKLYVMYAKIDNEGEEVKGAGNGYVSIFNTDGSFVKRFASGGVLNAPWGMTIAPPSFFSDSTAGNGMNGTDNQPLVLIGNFGDGYINAYTLAGGLVGPLKSHNQPIWIDGLWALSFPPASAPV